MNKNKKTSLLEQISTSLTNEKEEIELLQKSATFKEKLVALLRALNNKDLHSIEFKSHHNGIDWSDEILKLSILSDKDIVEFIVNAIEAKYNKDFENQIAKDSR